MIGSKAGSSIWLERVEDNLFCHSVHIGRLMVRGKRVRDKYHCLMGEKYQGGGAR